MLEDKSIELSKVPLKTSVRVEKLISDGLCRRRMMDLGIIPGVIIRVTRRSPLGDPRAYEIRGAEIALREEEASEVLVQEL